MSSSATRAAVITAALLVVGVLGVVGGVRWHEAVGRVMGLETAPARPAGEPRQLWTCSMHPQVIREEPGLCPICHMQLTPLRSGPSAGAAGEREVVIDPALVQNMGVRTETVDVGTLVAPVRAFGTLVEREPDLSDVTLRASGWIEHVYANTDGMEIKKGEPLFDLYSPELSQALEELIAARKETERLATADEGARRAAESLRESARAKLQRLGLAAAQVDALGELDAAPRIVTFLSPRSGHVRDRASLSNGSAVQAGQRVLRILDPSVLWLEVRVYERDLGRVRIGQRVEATIDAFPGETFTGLVSFIHPHLDDAARAGVVRVNIANEESKLREGMFASVRIRTDPGPETVVAPREAVIDTGERQLVFVALGEGRFEPRQVVVGNESDDGRVQILRGLVAGDRVVVSGQFLLDSESRLREAVRKYAGGTPPPGAGPAPEPVKDSGMPAGPGPMALPARIDAVYLTYLQLSAALGRVEESDAPVDPAGLILAARAMQSSAASGEDGSIAAEILAAAQALSVRKLAEQRERFKALGAAMVRLAGAHPPSVRVAPKLYLMHCPMAPGDWLQTSDVIANPFFARDMKECAEIVREIPARSDGARPQ